MVFRLANMTKSYAMLKAYRFINLYRTSTAEINLNKYCIKNYGKSLKQVCHTLLLHATFNTNGSELIITFKTKQDDDLAALITYGNGILAGSNILQFAFERK